MFDRDGILAWVKLHFIRKRDLTASSAGAADRNRPVALGATGKLNANMMLEAQTLTIAAGVVTTTVTAPIVLLTVTAESGVADDLTTINGTVVGQIVIVRPTVGHTITAKDSAGGTNAFVMAGDFAMNSFSDMLTLLKTGGGYQEISRSNNA